MGRRRILAIDYLRTAVILLVLVHHSVIAYAPYANFNAVHYLWGAPIVDSRRWLGFDLLTLFNDIFFMPLMFFLSGLFVWSSLQRKGWREFLRDRVVRLGLPFLFVVTFVMPLAYYPSFLLSGENAHFLAFWLQCFSIDNWPGGPAWFVWLLLTFDCVAAFLYKIFPTLFTALGRMTLHAGERPAKSFVLLLIISAAAYLPMLLVFGPSRWFTLGPFSVQASRLLLYFVYFFAGIAAGTDGVGQGMLAPGGRLERQWMSWLLVATALYWLVVSFHVIPSHRWGRLSSLAGHTIYGLAFLASCAATSISALALFLRFMNKPVLGLDSLSPHTYGIYLIHYVFVIWLQYLLLEANLPAVAKAAMVFTGTLALSWSTIATVRRVPAVARII